VNELDDVRLKNSLIAALTAIHRYAGNNHDIAAESVIGRVEFRFPFHLADGGEPLWHCKLVSGGVDDEEYDLAEMVGGGSTPLLALRVAVTHAIDAIHDRKVNDAEFLKGLIKP